MSIPVSTHDISEEETPEQAEDDKELDQELDLSINLAPLATSTPVSSKTESHECSHHSEKVKNKAERSDFSLWKHRITSIVKIACLILLVLCTLISLILGVFKEGAVSEQLRKQTANTIDVITKLAAIQGKEY